MVWKLWGKKTASAVNESKLPKPRDLPSEIGRKLVVEKNYDPDWVWNLKYVQRKQDHSKSMNNFRIYSPIDASSNGIAINDFNSLDHHPDLILFDGWFDNSTRQVGFEKMLQRAS